jgi:endonuclease/exonuclease/phosphatase (EEP) superfamily protein YafD
MWGRAELRGAALALGGVLAIVLFITSSSPGLPGELLLQTLRFHLVALGLVLALAMALLGARWRAAMFTVVLAIAFAHGAYYLWEFQSRRDAPQGPLQAEMTLLSYNVLSANRTAEDAVRYIIETAPDVALIMETPGVSGYLPAIGTVLRYRLGCEMAATCDISLFSRHPIEAGEIRPLPPFRRARLVIAPMTIDGAKVTVVGVHLSKPYFDEASVAELAYLRWVLAEIEGRVILAGDFNSAPWTGPMARLGRLQDLVSAGNYPATWPVPFGPLGVPIDNVFTRGDARILELAAGEDTYGSNHRLLLARIGLYGAS